MRRRLREGSGAAAAGAGDSVMSELEAYIQRMYAQTRESLHLGDGP